MSSLNIDLSEKINNRLPSQDEHSSRDETPPITQFSTSSDRSQQRRSLRQSKPPNRYGVWLKQIALT